MSAMVMLTDVPLPLVVGGVTVLLGVSALLARSLVMSRKDPGPRRDLKRKSTGFQSRDKIEDTTVDDQEGREWGADCGVGATALWIASVRHREKDCKPPTFSDPFAERFLRNGKGHEVSDAMAKKLHHFMFMDQSGENFDQSLTLKYIFPFIGRWYVNRMRDAPVDPKRITEPGRDCVRQGIRLRTAFLDKEIGKAFSEGSPIKQFVTLASGCDCRCLRLECLQGPGIKKWCVDQTAVINAFNAALPELKEKPEICTLAINFGEENWWDRLIESGFDPKVPTFFLVEGLVMYLEEHENQEVFEHVAELMAPGSVLAGDYINKGWLLHPMVEPMQNQLRKYRSPWTWGVHNSGVWSRMLRKYGLKVQYDMPSVQAKSLLGDAKLKLIDYVTCYIPSYRTYVAVK